MAFSTNFANATTIAEISSKSVVETQSVQSNKVKQLGDKINKGLVISKTKITFDANKAAKAGLSNEQIKSLKNTYKEMDQLVQNKTLSIIKTNKGTYDIKSNASVNTGIKASTVKSGITANTVVRSSLYTALELDTGWMVTFSKSQCNDVAAILAGGSASAATLAGILGLTGVGIPAAIVSTIAAGILGVGSAYFWYSSNHVGATVLTTNGKFSISNT